MKKSELSALISQIIKEEFSKPPKFGDIQPTDQKTGERPGMMDRPKDGMSLRQQKNMLWAEGLDLPEPTKSEVEMPFKIVKFPDIDSMEDCTISMRYDVLKDSRDITDSVVDIDLNDPYLFATQENLHLSLNGMKQHLENKNDLPIVVGFPNKVMLIQDGHHRLAIQKILNKNTAQVRLLVLNDWTDVEPETENWIKGLGPINEVCALAGGAVVATSDGSGFASKEKQKEKHEKMWSEEKIGKSGPHGVTYFQMGSSLPDALYNQKNGKPSRDPGIAGDTKKTTKVNESFYHGTTADVEPGQYILPPTETGNVSEKGRKKI